MKKNILFLFALLAMVSSTNAQRAWAYGLGLSSEGDAYTFTFKATTAAEATLVLYQEGAEVGTVALGDAVAGDNSFTLTKDQINQVGVYNWGVKLDGEEIALAELVTSVGTFYMPFGLGINNNPESKFFGNVYMANPWDKNNQSATGFYVLDPNMVLDSRNLSGETKIGLKPKSPVLKNTRCAIQRTAVSPVDGTIAFTQWENEPYAVYGIDPENLEGDAVSLTEGIDQPVSVCYDQNGTLFVMAYEGKDAGGKHVFTIYSIVDGVKTAVYSANDWVSASGDNDIASDGHGGIWILNGKHDVSVGQLRHITKNGVADLTINQGTGTLDMPAKYRRVRIGYDLRHDVFAIGGEGKMQLYNASYDEDGQVTLQYWTSTPLYQSGKTGWDTDGIAFDYAGDLVTVSASSEYLYKYALPTTDNTCTTPAPKTQLVSLDPSVKQYTLTVEKNGQGEVTGTGIGLNLEGTQYELTATPAENNKFINWTLSDATSTENPLTGVLNSDLTVTANFEELAQYSITTHVDGLDMGTVEGAGMYYEGQEVTLTAKANQGYAFVKWDDETTEPTITFTATAAVERTAYFRALAQYAVTAHIATDPNMGTVEGAGLYYEGQEVTLTAKANQGYAFVKWDDETTSPTITFTPTEDVTRTAYFKKISPRAWAYGLKMTEDADNYTFTFTTTADGNVTILFKDKDGDELPVQYPIGDVEAGVQTHTIAKSQFAEIHSDAYWFVQIDGAEVTELAQLTDDDQNNGFWFAYGVGVNNCPESEYFGNIYISNPRHSSDSLQTGFYKYSPELVLDESIFVDGEKVGYKPANVTLANEVDAIQRMAVSPKDGTVSFVQWNTAPFAAYGMDPANLAGDAVNLTEGINQPVALCYDHEGSLCVLSFDKNSIYSIYIIKDGETTKFFSQAGWVAGAWCELASDGQGGFYVMSGKLGEVGGVKNVVTAAKLQHISKNAEIDLTVLPGGAELDAAPSTFNRLRLAYDLKHDVFAIVGDKKVNLYNATYDAETGAPTLTKWISTPEIGNNVDGVAFDYAGDLYVVSAAVERFYKFVVPTEENICEVPAAKNQAIKLGAQCTVTVLVNEEAMGTVSGAGDYEVGATVTLTATAAPEHRFLHWTKDDVEVSTEEIYSFVAEENVTLVAHFEAISKYNISAGANDGAMGTVTGGGEYLEGESVELSATAKSGYVFVEWNDGEKSATRTITVTEDATYTAIFQGIEARAWAYALNMEEDGEDYVFSFTATATANATLHFEYTDGTHMMSHPVGQVTAGPVSPITIAKSEFAGTKDVRWSVELDGNEITELAKLTDDSKYNGFWFAYGVGVNNCPESPYFGNIYVSNPRHSSKPNETGFYKYSPELVLDETIFEAGAKVGYKPANVTLANAVDAIQRMAVSPVDGTVAFVQWKSAPFAAYGMNPANLAGDAVNLTEGINQPVALCYDHEGSLCVLSFDKNSIYSIYIIKDGETTKFFSQAGWVAGAWCELASDGQGGFYVMSGKLGEVGGVKNVVTAAKLQHISKNAEIDLTVLPGGAELDAAPSTFNRLRLAYDLKHDVFAIVGDKKVNLYNATYDAETGAPTLTKWISTPEIGNNVDGVAFDYAGDLYVVSAAVERFYKFVVPTEENICEVPAAKNQAIKLGAQCTVTVLVNEEAMGTVSGAGDYEVGATVTLTATAAPEHRFLHWTKDDVEVSTEEIYSFVAEENVTLVAHFEAISKYNISAGANDGAMGTVTGGGEYLEGESVELSATAKSGYVFVEWNDGEKSATRTITVTEDATYTAIFQGIEARAWAYALNMEEDGEDYVFSFTATATANATLHFEYTDGTHMMSHPVGQVTAGPVSPITIAKSEFAGTKDVRWSVELDGNEITELAKLTDDSKYNGFWFAYGVGVNNCPESPYFGNIYVSNPRHSSKPNETGFYKYSPELVLDETIFEAGAKVGYKPANVTLANAVDAIQRMAVSPVDGTVAFVQWNSSAPFAAYGMNPANLAGDAVNLTEGINQPLALCYDHEGSLCVLSFDKNSIYSIYIIKDGVTTKFFSQASWLAGAYCELASDGQGGFYVMSGKLDASNVVTSAKLQHISKKATIDFEVLPGGEELEDAPSTFNRLRLAYDLKHDVFALVGDKKVNLYNATYDAETGAPTLTKWISTPEIGNTVDGVAFDYAGDLYAVSAYTETFYKFVLPTVENVCIVPAADTIIVDKPKYIRAVAEGNYGTICLPYASSSFTGATFYEVSSLVYGEGLWLDQLADGAQLEAGKPYIFQATANEITVTYTGEAVGAPVAGANGLTGTFTDIAEGGLTGNYIIAVNKVWVAGSGATLPANCAYINKNGVPTTEQPKLAGRHRVIMGAEDEGTSTGFENITTTDKAVKVIENGQLIIIRNGEKFNAQGVKF